MEVAPEEVTGVAVPEAELEAVPEEVTGVARVDSEAVPEEVTGVAQADSEEAPEEDMVVRGMDPDPPQDPIIMEAVTDLIAEATADAA